VARASDSGGPPGLWSVLARPVEVETVVNRSRFLALAAPCPSPEAAAEIIAQRRARHHAARHHCWAFVVGPEGAQQRSSDDGEPAGTAGVPLLEVLRRRRVTDTVAVVTRYFGGILLGAPGLVRAYSGALTAALDEAALERVVQRAVWEATWDHARGGRVEHVLRVWADAHGATVTVAYGPTGATARVTLAPDDSPGFAEAARAAGAGAKASGTTTVRLR
jgi:uncharacterized YigZ family protein